MLFTHQTIKLIILICFFIKLILANYIPFLNDEAYAIAFHKNFHGHSLIIHLLDFGLL